MTGSKIIVLGAAGTMAQVTLRDLLRSKEVGKIGLADLRLDRIKETKRRLGSDRLEPIEVDARDKSKLTSVFGEWDVVVNSAWYELNMAVMGSAIQAGLHYVDLGGLYHYTLKQLERSSKARDAGVSCILGIGSAPGLTNLMASYLARKFDRIKRVRIRTAASATKSGSRFRPPYSIRTILDECTMPAVVLRNGKTTSVPALSGKEDFVMPEPIGHVEGYYTLHSELATLPGSLAKGVSSMDFVVAFSPEFARTVELLVRLGLADKTPIQAGAVKVSPYDVLSGVLGKPPQRQSKRLNVAARRVEIDGKIDDRDVTMRIDSVSRPHKKWGIDGRSIGTGIPPSVAAQWLGNGKIKRRGVFPPELCIDPIPFLREIDSFGRGIRTSESVELPMIAA